MERGRNNLAGGHGLLYLSELIKTNARQIRNEGDQGNVKIQRCEGVGAKELEGAVPKVAIFNIIFLCGLYDLLKCI